MILGGSLFSDSLLALRFIHGYSNSSKEPGMNAMYTVYATNTQDFG